MSFLGILLMLSYYFIIDITHVLVLAGCNWALPGNYSYFSFLKEWRAYSVMLTTSFVWIPFTWCVWLVRNCSQSDDFSLQVSVEVSQQMLSPPDAELMPLPCQLQTCPEVFWFFFFQFCWQWCLSLSVSWGAAGATELFEMEQCYLLLSINPFCLFSAPCLGLGPSCLPMFFIVESFLTLHRV